MTIEHFRFLFSREYDVFYLTEHIMLMKKPFSIWFEETDTTVKFKSVDEMLKYEIDGTTVESIIKTLDKSHTPNLEGGEGDRWEAEEQAVVQMAYFSLTTPKAEVEKQVAEKHCCQRKQM